MTIIKGGASLEKIKGMVRILQDKGLPLEKAIEEVELGLHCEFSDDIVSLINQEENTGIAENMRDYWKHLNAGSAK